MLRCVPSLCGRGPGLQNSLAFPTSFLCLSSLCAPEVGHQFPLPFVEAQPRYRDLLHQALLLRLRVMHAQP